MIITAKSAREIHEMLQKLKKCNARKTKAIQSFGMPKPNLWPPTKALNRKIWSWSQEEEKSVNVAVSEQYSRAGKRHSADLQEDGAEEMAGLDYRQTGSGENDWSSCAQRRLHLNDTERSTPNVRAILAILVNGFQSLQHLLKKFKKYPRNTGDTSKTRPWCLLIAKVLIAIHRSVMRYQLFH